MVDTAHLWPFTVLLYLINSFYLYLLVIAFPPSLLLIILYTIILYFLKRQAQRINWIIPIIILHAILIITSPLESNIVWIPFLLFAAILLFNLILAKTEVGLFNRTVLSLNPTDRVKARNALRTRNIEDITDVAKYIGWEGL